MKFLLSGAAKSALPLNGRRNNLRRSGLHQNESVEVNETQRLHDLFIGASGVRLKARERL